MNTQEARNAYPELIVGGVDSQWNVTGTLKCSWAQTKTVAFAAGPPGYLDDSTATLRVHEALEEAFRALAAVFKLYGYTFNETAGGTVSCRKITGGNKTSPHAHGIALDINPSKNPYGSSKPDELDLPHWQAMIASVKNVRTVAGHRVFKWGGDWSIDDDMHFEPTECTRSQLEAGIDWATVPGTEEEMRVREFVEGLAAATKPDGTNPRIDQLVDAKVIGGGVPASVKTYWTGKLGNPDDPAWKNFVNALEVATAVNAAKQAAAATLNVSLTGTAKPV
jgi:hypothetical protein